MTEEPDENIGGGGSTAAFDPDTAGTRAEAIVDRLGELYWTKTYGGRDAFECLVRTILSQNTSDTASQPAHDALLDRYGGAHGAPDTSGERHDSRADGDGDLVDALAAADQETLAETIRPAGLYNQKSERIIELAGEIREEFGGESGFDGFARSEDPDVVRNRLLEMNGVGPKTADCVLLFAGGRGGVFPVDTHVHRIARRMGIAPADADHETVRERIERTVPAEKCGFGHTAMIQFGREYCKARRPACLDDPEACPLADRCDQVGVSPERDEVADPADAH